MSSMTELECEVGRLIIDSLNLEDITLKGIDPDAALFNEGWGLDSIDALELSMALSVKYSIQLRSDDPDNKRIFSSLRVLTEYVASNGKA